MHRRCTTHPEHGRPAGSLPPPRRWRVPPRARRAARLADFEHRWPTSTTWIRIARSTPRRRGSAITTRSSISRPCLAARRRARSDVRRRARSVGPSSTAAPSTSTRKRTWAARSTSARSASSTETANRSQRAWRRSAIRSQTSTPRASTPTGRSVPPASFRGDRAARTRRAPRQDLHVYVTTCEISATRDGASVTLLNTIVFGDPSEHRIVEWKVEQRPGSYSRGARARPL